MLLETYAHINQPFCCLFALSHAALPSCRSSDSGPALRGNTAALGSVGGCSKGAEEETPEPSHSLTRTNTRAHTHPELLLLLLRTALHQGKTLGLVESRMWYSTAKESILVTA